MRRTAAILVLALSSPCPALAQQSPQRDLQLLIQAGVVTGPRLDFSNAGSGGTIGVLWTPWAFGGFWSEFGVMSTANEGFFALPAFGHDTPFNQHLETSAGAIVQGDDANSICPYLRAGAGAYRYEAGDPVRFLEAGSSYSRTHWAMGATLAAGARFGPSRLRALPTIEARIQIEGGGPDSNEPFYSLLGGVWFR